MAKTRNSGGRTHRRVELKGGRSSRAIARTLLFIVVLVPPVVAVCAWLNGVGSDPANADWKPAFIVSICFLTALVFGGYGAYVAMRVRQSEERKAGYTLINDEKVEVPLVDFATGIVLREANEPMLEHREYLRRRASARASSRWPETNASL